MIGRIAYIIRGLPGSGKSTLTQELHHLYVMDGISCRYFNTDEHFVEKGVYRFDPSKLGEYHERNYQEFCDALQDEVSICIVDNTNTQKWEYERYVEAAKEAGYNVVILTVGQPKDEAHIQECIERNIHKCPAEAIRRMSNRFEF